MDNQDLVVAVYAQHESADKAVRELQKGGFDITKLSIVGKDYRSEENIIGYYNTGDRMKYWGSLGAFVGGVWGLLSGAAFLLIPGLGPLVVAGPLVVGIVGALEGAVAIGGLSVVGAGLYSLGIPKNSIIRYEIDLRASNFLVIAHGTAEEAAKAREMLVHTSPEELDIHSSPAGQLVSGNA